MPWTRQPPFAWNSDQFGWNSGAFWDREVIHNIPDSEFLADHPDNLTQYPPPYYEAVPGRFGVEPFNHSKRLMERLGPDSGEPREREPAPPRPPEF